MMHAHCIVSQNPSGYGLTDGRCFPCLSVPGRSVTVSPSLNHKVCTQVRIAFPKCMYMGPSFVCKAGSSGHRRNPDFSRQKQGFRGKNRSNEERENFEDLDDSEMFSKNGSLVSLSSSPKFQATSAPGHREKEIVELFKKVQAQLRERAALKEEKRFEASQGKAKESETVDSLLKLLRKHSVEQDKKSNSGPMDQSVARSEENGLNNEHKRSSSAHSSKKSTFFGSNNRTMNEVGETGSPALNRPLSNFRRRSPVPHVKYQPVTPDEDIHISNSVVSANSMSPSDAEGKNHADSKWSSSEPGLVPEFVERVIGPGADDEDDLDGSEDQNLHIDEVDGEDECPELEDLTALKLAELKAMAKSRGVKGYSKMKKAELVELLGSNTSA